MAALLHLNKIMQELECAVCLKQFDNKDHVPFLLHCGHNICQESAIKIKKVNIFGDNPRIKCPQCNQESRYEYDVQNSKMQLVKNFALCNIVEKLNQEKIQPSQILIPIEAYLSKDYIDIVNRLTPIINDIKTWSKTIKKQLVKEESEKFYQKLQNWETLEKKRKQFKKKRDKQVKYMLEAEQLLNQFQQKINEAGYSNGKQQSIKKRKT